MLGLSIPFYVKTRLSFVSLFLPIRNSPYSSYSICLSYRTICTRPCLHISPVWTTLRCPLHPWLLALRLHAGKLGHLIPASPHLPAAWSALHLDGWSKQSPTPKSCPVGCGDIASPGAVWRGEEGRTRSARNSKRKGGGERRRKKAGKYVLSAPQPLPSSSVHSDP